MESHNEDEFFVGDWRVRPSQDEIIRGKSTVRLEPKTMDVLVYLAKHRQVVSRGDLEREVWQGALVGDDAVTNTIVKLRRAFGDTAKNPSYIATIPKRGYRLVAPVTLRQNASEHRTPPHNNTAQGCPAFCADNGVAVVECSQHIRMEKLWATNTWPTQSSNPKNGGGAAVPKPERRSRTRLFC